MSVSLKFLGAVGTVTGSSHLLTTDKSQILLDAGLFQGRREEFYRKNTTFNFNPHKINAMVLSHAHIDHCGNIPGLIKKGLRSKIYATSATKDLASLMLEDSGKIQEEDIKYVNKINRRLGLPLRKPLYTKNEARKAAKRFRCISYKQRFCLSNDVFVTLLDAGHILGSSIVTLEIKTNGASVRLGYAADLGREGLPLINDPVVPGQLDYLIMESTYGGRVHTSIEEGKIKFRDVINRTLSRKGKILIPSFALERTQEALYFLNEFYKENSIPRVPIYVDSPLATDVTEVFKFHQSYFDEKTRRDILTGNSPFELLNLKYIRAQKDSKRLNDDKRPMIIIAGSGMCESGRILHHLKNNIEDTRNTILVVGYMAKDTLGRRIVEKERIVRIFGVEYESNAEVVVINAFSGHADRNELCKFAHSCLPLKKIFIVHGDAEQSQALSESLTELGINNYLPQPNEEVLLN